MPHSVIHVPLIREQSTPPLRAKEFPCTALPLLETPAAKYQGPEHVSISPGWQQQAFGRHHHLITRKWIECPGRGFEQMLQSVLRLPIILSPCQEILIPRIHAAQKGSASHYPGGFAPETMCSACLSYSVGSAQGQEDMLMATAPSGASLGMFSLCLLPTWITLVVLPPCRVM